MSLSLNPVLPPLSLHELLPYPFQAHQRSTPCVSPPMLRSNCRECSSWTMGGSQGSGKEGIRDRSEAFRPGVRGGRVRERGLSSGCQVTVGP